MKRTILILVASMLGGIAAASDLAREDRISRQIADEIFDGDVAYLEAQGHKFLTIFTPSDQPEPKGAAIILHGRGFHPDWNQVARPLRLGLAKKGWHTLSLQMPVLGPDAKYYDYVPVLPEAHARIDAALRHLREKGIRNIVLIAHSCGAHMAMSWVDATGAPGIAAYVGIGMGATDYKQPMAKPLPLDRLTVPILDIYGGADYGAVIRMAPDRWRAIGKGGNPKSKQLEVPDADHYFNDQGAILVEQIAAWLDTL
jgi:pimeloyl-ACP methyl ester carboxylesterase